MLLINSQLVVLCRVASFGNCVQSELVRCLQGPEVCSGCGAAIRDQHVLRVGGVSGESWHAACLRCAACRAPLAHASSCYVRAELAHCKACYQR